MSYTLSQYISEKEKIKKTQKKGTVGINFLTIERRPISQPRVLDKWFK